jgi:hypothetical protein
MLEMGAPFDYGSRSLLKVRLYSVQERSSDPHPSALFQGNFVCDIPKFRVLFENRVNLLSKARVFEPHLLLDRSI